MTDNQYWLFLEDLRKSGVTNMYGAAPYVERFFDVTHREAVRIVADWMEHYDPLDYVGNAQN